MKRSKRKRTIKRKSKKLELIKRLTKIAALLSSLGLIVLGVVFVYLSKDIPSLEELKHRNVIESTKIYDRTGKVLLYEIHGEEKRTIIPFDQIPKSLINATIAIEDDNFYNHMGFDFKAIIRAFVKNLKGQTISQGGSTITQQFVKNSILTPEKTYSRKIKEVVLSLELERTYTKDEILEFYLNQIPYGSNAYGIQAASQTFFEKDAKDLTLAESALLAALPRAPSYYSPFGSHPEELKKRQESILDKMAKLNYITQKEKDEAKKEELKFSRLKAPIKAPHFVMYVKEYIEDKYGQDVVEQKGLKVYTTLNWDLQQLADEIIKERALINEKKYNAGNASLVAIDPKTGQILAMVGSRDYFDIENDGNVNVAIRDRQPGSSFKPYAYATAFKKGYTPDTVVFDLQTNFGTYGGRSYIPKNYDGKFRGPLTFRKALSQSLNIPAVKVLYLAGVNNTITTAKKMGITTLNEPERYGLSLVLGGGEVKLLDHVAAYGVFAAEGIKNEKTAILKIEDKDGNVLEQFQENPERVLDVQVSRLINDILSDNASRAPMFGVYNNLYLGNRPVAAKTGTTNEFRDGWIIGYTPSLVAGVWTGNNDNKSMWGPGVSTAGPIWNKFMKQALKNAEIERFVKPKQISTDKPILNGEFVGEKTVKIDKISGKLATEFTPPELIEEKKYKEVHTILYYVDKDNPRGDFPDNPEADPQFAGWESAVLKWASSPEQSGNGKIYNEAPPSEYDDIHIPQNVPKVEITSPKNNQTIGNLLIRIEVDAEARLGIKQVDFFVDDKFIGVDRTSPFSLRYRLPINTSTSTVKSIIKVRAFDTALNSETDSIVVKIKE